MKTIIIGTGCAGYNAADWLYDLGERDIVIITEGINMGTSRNTGSDKQTYYKLSLAGAEGDSVREMAETLYAGIGVNGDTALIEAAGSVKSFMKLVHLGVPFPMNAYGEYVGYKTDHDPRQRATSCGPLTSKLMTEALEKSVKSKKIEIIDNTYVAKIVVSDNRVCGVIGISTITGEQKRFECGRVILAAGGPAGIYEKSVYPISQTGATGLATNAGAETANLQEWQYGLASIKFRWNVSGTYQQVLPKYISVDRCGNTREFLLDYYSDPTEALNMVFLKGYQWPFDVRKIDASSKIDELVHAEITKGNRVFMDFRSNPTGLAFNKLSDEAYTYLSKSGALFGTPLDRLEKMNKKAIELYRNNGIDLYHEPLEVAVCAQHCNGGIAVDANWESSVKGLYVVGEAAGTFGVYRPGGSALNATQVGSMRAAEHIAYDAADAPVEMPVSSGVRMPKETKDATLYALRDSCRKKMSERASFIRDTDVMQSMLAEFSALHERFYDAVTISDRSQTVDFFRFYDSLSTQIAVLSAMIFAAKKWGSRGSALVIGESEKSLEDGIVITGKSTVFIRKVREMPNGEDWFENVWNNYNRRIGQ